jgi:hypothetical protein
MTPDAELAEARTFLSGWTLSRYVERFRAEAERSNSRSVSEAFVTEGGDGVTPCFTLTQGGGAFGWSRVGPPPVVPGATPAKRRPKGVLTIPSNATVGQVRFSSELLFHTPRRASSPDPPCDFDHSCADAPPSHARVDAIHLMTHGMTHHDSRARL